MGTLAEMDDERLGRLVRDAFDSVGPTEEAEDRMLAAILAHASERGQDADDDPRGDEPTLTVVGGGKRPIRRRRPWLVALPAAACLVIALVAGISSLGGEDGKSAAVTSEESAVEYAYDLDAGAGSGEEAAPKEAEESVVTNGTYGDVDEEMDSYEAAEADAAEAETEGLVVVPWASDLDTDAPIVLDGGSELHLVLSDGEPVPVADDDVVGYVGSATAAARDGGVVTCEVYDTADGGFAVLLAEGFFMVAGQ